MISISKITGILPLRPVSTPLLQHYHQSKILLCICIVILGAGYRGQPISKCPYSTISHTSYLILQGPAFLMADMFPWVTTKSKMLIRTLNQNIKIVLWGRSMGAVTALRYLANNKKKNVIISVFDSPFISLKQLFLQIGKQKTSFPKIVLEMALKYIKPIILKKASFNIEDVNLNNLSEVNCPGVFIASKNDALIPFTQMDSIFRQYKGEKEMLFVEESHNQPRNTDVIKEVFKTLHKFLNPPSTNRIHQDNELFSSQIPEKQTSRKKLQLTIKSYSQKNLFLSNQKSVPKKSLQEIDFPHLQKRQISCLLNHKKKTLKCSMHEIQEKSQSMKSSSLLKLKKPTIVPRFFKDQNKNDISQNVIKFKSNKMTNVNFSNTQTNLKNPSNKNIRDQQRKTMQHMIHKKPPLIEQHKLCELRNSFQIKYKTEFRK